MAAKSPLDRLRSDKKPLKLVIAIPLDQDLADAYFEAETERDDARATATLLESDEARRKAEDAQAKFDAARDALASSTLTFTLQSLPRRRFEALVMSHPPTDFEIERARSKGAPAPDFSADTLPPALLAECIVSVEADGEISEFGLDDAKALWESDEWGGGETALLWESAFSLCQTRRVVDLKKG